MNERELLVPGEIVRFGDGTIWYVDSVTGSGAHVFELTGHPAPITTRKGVTKMVMRHGKTIVIAADAIVEKIDPAKLDQLRLRRRIKMARKENAPEETEGQENGETQADEAKPARATQAYVRTKKTPKEGMRGQGKIVLDALDKAKGPVTVGDLTKTIGKFEGSRQDPERVIGFYLSKFKREGLVKVAEAASSEATEEAVGAAAGE